MPPGRPSRLQRSLGLWLARHALWRALAVRGDKAAAASLAVAISGGGMDRAIGSTRMFGERSDDVPRGFGTAPAGDQRRSGRAL